MNQSLFLDLVWQNNQHLNFGEANKVAEAAAKAANDMAFELTKAKIAEVGVKVVDAETFYRRELTFIGEGSLHFHVTVWGDSALKVQVGVLANDVMSAQKTALVWARKSWFCDKRTLGIEKVERPSEQAVTV